MSIRQEAQGKVTATVSGADGAILDGANSAIKATVTDLTNSNPLAVSIVDGDGTQVTSFGGGTQYTEDAAAAANPVGTAVNLIRADTPAGITTTDGDNVAQRGTDYGAAYVTLLDTAGSPVSVGGGTQYTEDAAAAANPIGTALNLIRTDTPAGRTTTDGDNVAACGTDKGELYVKHTDSIAVTGTFFQATQPVSAASLPLPTGAATAANQQTDALTDTQLRATAVPVSGTVAVTNAGLTELAAAINSSKVDVNIVSSDIATGGTSEVDDADFTAGTTPGTPSMGVFESSPTSVTDGDLGIVGITAARRLKTSATIDAALPAGTNNIGDVDVLSSALPTGASTLAEQQSQTTLLGTIDADTSTLAAVDYATQTTLAAINAKMVTGTDIGDVTINNAAGAAAVNIQDGGNAITVDGTVAVTGVSTLAEQQTQTTHLATIAGDTTDIEAAVELLDDTVATLGTTTYTEAATKGLIIGAVRRDADTTLVDTTNEVGPVQMNAAGQLKVEVFSGETLPVTLTSTTVTGTVAVTQSGTWDEVGINDSGNSITVDNAQLSVVGGGTEAAAMRVTIANDSTGVISVDDGGGVLTVNVASGGIASGAIASGAVASGAVASGAFASGSIASGAIASGAIATGAIAAGTASIAQLEDVAHSAAEHLVKVGTRRIDTLATSVDASGDWATPNQSAEGALWATLSPTTTSGLSISRDIDLDNSTLTVVKNAAGNLYGYYISNTHATLNVYVKFYNATSGTLGTGTPVLTFMVPFGGAANVAFTYPISFSTGICVGATTDVADAGTTDPGANIVISNIFYK